MKQAPYARPVDAIETECPYCGKDIVEVNGDMRDYTGPSIEESGELTCPHCNKDFAYTIEE